MDARGSPDNVIVSLGHSFSFQSSLTRFAASVYRIPLQSPAATVKSVKAIALVLNDHMEDVTVKHPLVSSRNHSYPNNLNHNRLFTK